VYISKYMLYEGSLDEQKGEKVYENPWSLKLEGIEITDLSHNASQFKRKSLTQRSRQKQKAACLCGPYQYQSKYGCFKFMKMG
jgi:hypothetical protein